MVADKNDHVEKLKPAQGDHPLQQVSSDLYKFGNNEGRKILSEATRSISAAVGSLPQLHLFDGSGAAAIANTREGLSPLSELGKSGLISGFQHKVEGLVKEAEAAGLGAPFGDLSKWLTKDGAAAAPGSPHGGRAEGGGRSHAGHEKEHAGHEKTHSPSSSEKPHAPIAKPDGHVKHHDDVKPNTDKRTVATPEKTLSPADKAAEKTFMDKLDEDGAKWWRSAHYSKMLNDVKNMTPEQQELYRTDKNFAKMVDGKLANDMTPILGTSSHDEDKLHAAQHELHRVKKGESPQTDDLTTKLYKHAADERWTLPSWAPTSSEPMHQQAALKDLRDAEKKDPTLHDRIAKGRTPEDAELRRAARQSLGEEEYQKYVHNAAHK